MWECTICVIAVKKKKKNKRKVSLKSTTDTSLPVAATVCQRKWEERVRAGLRRCPELLLKETVTLDGTASSSIWNQQVQYRLTCLQGRSLTHLGQVAFLRSILWIFRPVLLVKDSWGSGMKCRLSGDCPDQTWLTEEWLFLSAKPIRYYQKHCFLTLTPGHS